MPVCWLGPRDIRNSVDIHSVRDVQVWLYFEEEIEVGKFSIGW